MRNSQTGSITLDKLNDKYHLLLSSSNAGVVLLAGIEDCDIGTGAQEHPAESQAAALGVLLGGNAVGSIQATPEPLQPLL